MNEQKYTRCQIVPASYIDSECRMTVYGMVSYTQDITGYHATATKITVPHMHQKGLTWIVSKQRFVIEEYPLWMDEFAMTTWSNSPRGILFNREYEYSYIEPNGKKDFLSLPEEGRRADENLVLSKPFFRGNSLWLVLDSKTMRPVKVTEDVLGTLPFCDELAVEGGFPKINLPEEMQSSEEFTPTLMDIDINDHVNHTVYVHWILSWLPKELVRSKSVHVLETHFINSAMYGDKLVVKSARVETNTAEVDVNEGDITYVHSVVRVSDGTEMFRAKTVWRDTSLMSRKLKV